MVAVSGSGRVTAGAGSPVRIVGQGGAALTAGMGIGRFAYTPILPLIGAHLQVPCAVAILTTGYSAGQVVGPLAVTPVLHNGYHQALLIGAGVAPQSPRARCATVSHTTSARLPTESAPLTWEFEHRCPPHPSPL